MQPIPAARLRWGGLIFVLGALFLLALGLYLARLVLGLPVPAAWIPAFLPVTVPDLPGGLWPALVDPAGLATLWLLAFGATALVIGLRLLFFARRDRILFFVLMLLSAIFFTVGIASVLGKGGTVPRLYR